MTKAKTKSRRVWLSLNERGAYRGTLFISDTRRDAYNSQQSMIIPATITWTPPAKAKAKRRAKR